MKKLIVFALAVVILTMGFSFSIARAETVSDCQALIADASADLAGVTLGGRHPDRTRASLQSKLDGASAKLDEGKYQDAYDKLVDFRTTVEQMATAAKPKISQEDAQLLITDANNALFCVESLIAGG